LKDFSNKASSLTRKLSTSSKVVLKLLILSLRFRWVDLWRKRVTGGA
jgi:hypothetical protein